MIILLLKQTVARIIKEKNMYTDDDLSTAVDEGIFTNDAVLNFKKHIESLKETPSIDEENFRLIGGFNDIFVVIACILLLFSSVAVLRVFSELLAAITFPLIAWGLAEFFVRKRRMALPAIVLLLSFVGGVFGSAMHLSGSSSLIATALAAIAAYLHYQRFQVPITIAAGTAASAGFIISVLLSIFPILKEWMMPLIFISGVSLFFFAMYWDASDRSRKTRNSDVAFWLHLLSAPLIVHPVFTSLGIFDGVDSAANMIIVILLYLFMTLISICIDRRAFMVSSLAYVLYAITNILEAYGIVGQSFAVTGVCIGAALLLLSAFWHPIRKILVQLLPQRIQHYLPKLS